MGTLGKVAKILDWGKTASKSYGKFVTADSPIFTAYGRDIMVSDIVKTAVHRVAEAVSKCQLKSVIAKNLPVRSVESAKDEINALFAARVNPYMTLKDFLYKVGYKTVVNRNCFIYPAFDEYPISGTDKVKRIYRGFYPLEVTEGVIYNDGNGSEMRIELSNGVTSVDLPYSDIIHIRLGYGEHPFLGGDSVGRFDARGLLQNLQVVQTIKECIPKTLEASLSIKGVLTMKGMPEFEKQIVSRDEFEAHIADSKYGLIATDYATDFTPINIASTDIPTNIMDFIQRELLYPFGVSLPIMTGNYNDDEYAAFYQTAVEGILISIAKAFTATLFTPAQLARGHEIRAYDRLTQSLSIERRIKMAELTKDDALLSADERRELLGYEPDGRPTRVSLNYIDVAIANEYQLADLKNKTPAEPQKQPEEVNEENAEQPTE